MLIKESHADVQVTVDGKETSMSESFRLKVPRHPVHWVS